MSFVRYAIAAVLGMFLTVVNDGSSMDFAIIYLLTLIFLKVESYEPRD